MNIRHTPNTVAAPFGPYSHAIEVPEGSRLLYISGEVGVLPDGTRTGGDRSPGRSLLEEHHRHSCRCRHGGRRFGEDYDLSGAP
jgi:hypothetical protein